MRVRRPLLSGSILLGLCFAAPLPAGAQDPAATAPIDPALIDGPPAPVPPAVVSRDEQGRVTVRAVRYDEGIDLDGVLDEPIYAAAPPITGFVQLMPDAGAPATERTEAWILFDDTNVYISARVWDSAPESRWVANEMRRDTRQLRQNDTFTVLFDTFYDRRNGFSFYTNPLGARADAQLTNEGNPMKIGILSGMFGPAASTAAGRSRWRSPSGRCATGPSRRTSGACSSGAPSGGRTSGST